MVARLSEMVHEWMGWCPNALAIRTAPAVLGTGFFPDRIFQAHEEDLAGDPNPGSALHLGCGVSRGERIGGPPVPDQGGQEEVTDKHPILLLSYPVLQL